MPWGRAWQHTPTFLPGESLWTEEPGGLQSMRSQESDMTEWVRTHIMIFKRMHSQIIPETSSTYLTCSTSTLSLTSHFLALPLSSYHSLLTHKPCFHHRSLHLLSPACNSLCSIRATWLLFTYLNSLKSHPMTGIIFPSIECESKSRSVLSDSLWPHESQHARPPCPSPTPGVYPNPCPLSRWCH